MDRGQRTVEVFRDPHGDLNIMESVSIGRNLQTPALTPRRVVAGGDAVFLNTQHIGQIDPHLWYKRGALFRGWNGNALGVHGGVYGQELLDQILIASAMSVIAANVNSRPRVSGE
ncbi:MAG: hypothetical protein NTAFB01_42360 [Nitrospira sp.]